MLTSRPVAYGWPPGARFARPRQRATSQKNMNKHNQIPIGKETLKQLENIHPFGYSYSTIFSDFLDICLLALLSFTDNLQQPDFLDKFKQNKLTGKYEDHYLQMVAKYKENKARNTGNRPIDYFTHAWGYLQKETHETQQDILGEIFTTKISFGEHGQFFTPTSVADIMAQLSAGEKHKIGETVCDPCCGSGRLLISYSKLNNDAHFYGVDLSQTCAKMTALNMWLFNLNADIYHGNSLVEKYFHVWKVRKGGFIYEFEIKEDSPMPPSVKKTMLAQAKQQRLFDFEEVKK